MIKSKLALGLLASFTCFSLLLSACSRTNSSQNNLNDSDNLQESIDTSASTTSQMPYTISIENGNSSLYFSEEFTFAIEEDSALSKMPDLDLPKFSSVAEMKQQIETGDIPEQQLASLYIANGKKNTINIPDLSNLYNFRVPEDLTIRYIIWQGEYFEYLFISDYCDGSVSWLTEKAYVDFLNNSLFNYEGTNIDKLKENSSVTILSNTRVADRNATVIHYTTGSAELKRIEYQINSNGDSVTVCEQYVLDYFSENAPWETSDITPQTIYIYGVNDGANFFCFIWGLTERPTVEWLSSFGLQEYIETTAS